MQFKDVCINNLYHYNYDEDHSLLFCSLTTNSISKDPIIVPGSIKENVNLILDSKCDFYFRNKIEDYPVLSDYSITCYDHLSNVTSRLLKDRNNNKIGCVKNELKAYNLLSEIKIPLVTEGKTVLIIDSYLALEKILLEERKNQFLKQDLKKFSDNNEDAIKRGVHLIISKNVHDMLTSGSTDNYNLVNDWIETNFLSLNIDNQVVNLFLEIYLGKILNPSEYSFQKQLQINGCNEIISCTPCGDLKFNGQIVARSNGVLKINSYQEKSDFDFVCVVKRKKTKKNSPIVLKFDSDSVTSKSILDLFDSSNRDNVFALLNIFKKNVLFLESMNPSIKKRKLHEFVCEYSEEAIDYMFTNDNEIYYDKELGKHDILSLIKNCSLKYESNIRNTLINNIRSISPILCETDFKPFERPILGRQRTNYD